MSDFPAGDPGFEYRVRASFALQTAMQTIGATIESLSPGLVTLRMPFSASLSQQHGYVHAGVISMLADSACGYAALSLTAPEADVLTVEYKVNLLNPARGRTFLATGRVLRPGRRLTACTGEVIAIDEDGASTCVASMLSTMVILNPGAR